MAFPVLIALAATVSLISRTEEYQRTHREARIDLEVSHVKRDLAEGKIDMAELELESKRLAELLEQGKSHPRGEERTIVLERVSCWWICRKEPGEIRDKIEELIAIWLECKLGRRGQVLLKELAEELEEKTPDWDDEELEWDIDEEDEEDEDRDKEENS